MTERRQHVRRRTFLNGRIEVAKLDGWALDCPVRNLGDGGARLTLPDGVVVPQRVSLTISDRPRRSARLVWYRDGQAGFALEPCDDSDAPSAALAARIAAITGRRAASPHFTRH